MLGQHDLTTLGPEDCQRAALSLSASLCFFLPLSAALCLSLTLVGRSRPDSDGSIFGVHCHL